MSHPSKTKGSNFEIWVDMINWPDYQASNLGNIRSKPRFVVRKSHGRYFTEGVILRKSASRGYSIVTLYKGTRKRRKAARVCGIICTVFHGPRLGREVNHVNGIKSDDRAENLEWVSSSKNQLHAYRSGLQKGLEEHGMAKLTNRQARFIKLLFKCGAVKNRSQLSRAFRIGRTTLAHLERGDTWRSIYA